MNNILSFSEYNKELETIVYANEINEGIMGKGIRGFFNKRAAGRVKAELADEIEMSKTIMEGIQKGLDSLNDDFSVLKDELDKSDSSKKGEKQKALDAIVKLIEDSRKNTWDLNELIDEGEIDYSGFTANVGIASVAYFGILFTPFRSIVMIHKGYNYFFNIIKNTIRKALVMLQLNFDQFENLIITKGFQSLDYLQDQDTSVKISEFYGKLQAKLFDEKTGMMKGKRGSEYAKQQMNLAKQQIDAMMKADKSRKLSDNAYNCLDQYNNTYTRSLEALRNYTQEDVQKQLDSIKNSMNKLAGQEVDLQTYSELIIAAAEEHAYKVSSSIYSKFAKMTEVFSLPNQKKLIDLIQEATKEQMDAADKEAQELKNKENIKKLKEDKESLEKDGVEIFKSISDVEIGELDEDKNKYSDIKADSWTYEEFKKLDEEKKDRFETWLTIHTEVLEKCDDTLKVSIYTASADYNTYFDYVDSLIDYIGPCIEEVNESCVLGFNEYLFEDVEMNQEEDDDEPSSDHRDKSKKKHKKYYIDFDNINKHQIDDLKELYDNKEVAKVALETIGNKLLKDKTFVKNSDTIIDLIYECFDETKENKRLKLKIVTYNLISESIKKLKELRSHDYVNVEETKKSDE